MVTRCLNCMKTYDSQYDLCPHCGFIAGTPPKEPYHLHPGIRLQDRYVIGTVVDFGGFGIVYRAWDEQLDTMVAVKEFYPAGIVQRIPGEKEVIIYTGNSKKEFENGVERFLDEARNMAKFSSHPNIVNIYNFFEENNTAYIVMEFMNGVSLKKYLRENEGKLGIDHARSIISSVCEALKDIHKENIIHRDIAPDNIFICEKDVIKVFDFGAARFSTGDEERTRTIILKPGYAPPEQYRSKSKQGPWTDVYALAATLYRAVTGIVPEESVNRVIEDNVQPPAEVDPSIPVNLSNAIMKGMALTQELRFQSIQEFQDAILDKKKVIDLKKELKKRRRRRVIGIAIAGIIIAIGAFVGYEIFRDKKEEVVLPETTLSVWVPADESDLDSTKELYDDMASKFKEDQPSVQVEVNVIPNSEYEMQLADAKANNHMPTIYLSDGLSEDLISYGADVSEVFDYINTNDYYFLKKYDEYYPSHKQLPMGYTVPVVYVRRNMGINIDAVVIDEYDKLRTNPDDLYQDYLSYYIEPKAEYATWSSFSGVESEHGVLSTEIQDYKEQYLADLSRYSVEESDVNGAMDSFTTEAEGTMTYYVGTTLDLQTMNEKMVGRYEMRPIQTDHTVGIFTNCFSISSSASKDDIHAASVLLSYMLAEGPQKDMHIIHKNSIPINRQAYSEFINVNGKYEIITDYYLDVLTFEGEDQAELDRQLANQ